MSIGRIIVPVSEPRLLESKLDHALAVAMRFGSRIDVLFLHGSVDPLTIESNPFFGDAREVAEINWSQEESSQQNVETRLDRWSRERGVPYRDAMTGGARRPHVVFLEVKGEYQEALQEHGRTSDLIVVGQPGPGIAAMDVEINRLAVTESGRSTLIVPNEPPPAEHLLAHVLVAWDGGVQAATSIALAMPVLEVAQQVTVYTSGEPDSARQLQALVRDYLACNGVTAKCIIDDHRSRRIGRLLLDTAHRQGATLVCMGAYENPRPVQMIIGGNTRHVYSRSKVPVLFSS
jgi:nucleotide-binding universal stress UspA family protein